MNIFNKVTCTWGILLVTSTLFAQDPMVNDQAQLPPAEQQTDAVNSTWRPSLVADGAIQRTEHVNKALELHSFREIDVAWKRRVWREIDVRQKQNQAFIYRGDEFSGGGAFIEILLDAIKKGKVQAYTGIDDRFTEPTTYQAIMEASGAGPDTFNVPDPITGELTQHVENAEFNPESVTRYRVKEDWIFDRNSGRMVVRIVGIAPLFDYRDQTTGAYVTSIPMFWLYYPDLRDILVNYEVYNPQNDIRRITWTDFFDNHYFASYVIKTSSNNPTGVPLPDGLRGLQQGKELMNEIFEREMNMWQE